MGELGVEVQVKVSKTFKLFSSTNNFHKLLLLTNLTSMKEIMASYTSHVSTFSRKRRKFELLVCGYARLQSEQFNLTLHLVLIPLINLFYDSVFWWHLKTDQLNGLTVDLKQSVSNIGDQLKELKLKSKPFKASNGFVFEFYLHPNMESNDTKFIGFYWKIKSLPSLSVMKQLMIEQELKVHTIKERDNRNRYQMKRKRWNATKNSKDWRDWREWEKMEKDRFNRFWRYKSIKKDIKKDIAMLEPAKIVIHFAMSCKQIKRWNVECRKIFKINNMDSMNDDICREKIGWKWHKSNKIEEMLKKMNCLSFGCDIINISVHQKRKDDGKINDIMHTDNDNAISF